MLNGVLGARLGGMLQFRLAKYVEAKIRHVNAHHDEQRRDLLQIQSGRYPLFHLFRPRTCG